MVLTGQARLLLTHAQSMRELADRTRAALSAGCDVGLHCNGRLDEMQDVAAAAPLLSGQAARRADAALSARRAPEPIDLPAARQAFAAMVAQGAAVTS